MGLAELKADAVLLRERFAKMSGTDEGKNVDLAFELAENILPMFEGLVDAINEEIVEEVADLGEAVDELVDQSGDVLHPETAVRILQVFEMGSMLANELEKMFPKLDEISRKRVKQAVKAYRQGAQVIGEVIAEITMPVDPDEPDDAEPGDEDLPNEDGPGDPERPPDDHDPDGDGDGDLDDDADAISGEK